MSQFISHSEWENYFTEEALTVEEMLSSGDFLQFDQSKLRIALDNQLLNWNKFKLWIFETAECPCINDQISEKEIDLLRVKHHENKKTFSHYKIWSEDLIPLEMWDHSLIVLGLYPNENLVNIPNVIFVLCPPLILKQILSSEQSSDEKNNDDSKDSLSLLNIDPNIPLNSDMNFSQLRINVTDKNTSQSLILGTENGSVLKSNSVTDSILETEFSTTTFSIWNIVNKKHSESSDFARKKFDAYVVLKIENNKTQLFKMDEDLEKEDLNKALFTYDLNLPNAFTKVLKSGATESFELEKLGLSILDFKFASISPLMLGQQTVGFLLGLKIEKTTKVDEQTLESISNNNAA